MFINCKHCNALVATDPATDLPPERCARCAGRLREPVAAADQAPADAMPPAAPPATSPATPTISSLLVAPVVAPEPAASGAAAVDAIIETPESAGTATTDAPAPIPAPAVDAPSLDAVDAIEPARNADAGDAPPVSEAAPSVPAPVDAAGTDRPMPAQVIDPHPAAAPDAAPATATADAPAPSNEAADTDAAANAAPTFVPSAPRGSQPTTPRRWRAPAIIAALALLLGLQVLLADRARLAADAQWRPLVQSLCGVFGCTLPAWREPAAFTLLAREVRPHPQAAGALRVDATFRNDARWPQAWPRLLLVLSDVNGRPVAARAFDPDDYLAEPATAATLDSGASARIRIDLREPAAATVSYSFDFR